MQGRVFVLLACVRSGTLNWSKALPRSTEPSTGKPAWTFRLASFDLEGGSVAFEDLSHEPATKLDLADLALHATGITDHPTKPIPMTARVRLGERGTIEGSGTIAPSPVTADLKFAASDIDIVPLRPYIRSLPGARLGSGTATLQGQIAVSGDGPMVKLGANGSVDGVELQDKDGQRLAAWQKMTIDGLTIEDPANRTRIRANQGHSIEVELDHQPATPPDVLYHGTPEQFVRAILRDGLKKMQRHHVHLSPTRETKVGERRGKPVILRVDAKRMHADSFTFYLTPNNVWLVDEVPPGYLAIE